MISLHSQVSDIGCQATEEDIALCVESEELSRIPSQEQEGKQLT